MVLLVVLTCFIGIPYFGQFFFMHLQLRYINSLILRILQFIGITSLLNMKHISHIGITEAEFWFRVVIQVQALELESLEFESLGLPLISHVCDLGYPSYISTLSLKSLKHL